MEKEVQSDVVIKEREIWVDYAKGFACILVVIGHLLQGLVKANIELNHEIYNYINTTIYLFHMPLFMCLSGYLYCKTENIEDKKDYFKFIRKKIINLGVPYFVFYTAFIALNTLMSGYVNTNHSILDLKYMFTNPIPPFWFLYVLLFLFIVTPLLEKVCRNNSKWVLGIYLILKIISIYITTPIYAINEIFSWGLYFYIGKAMYKNIKKIDLNNIVLIMTIFAYLMFSLIYMKLNPSGQLKEYLKIIFAISGIYLTILTIKKYINIFNNKVYNTISSYTFVIYLLHVEFLACTRIVLIKLGIYNFWLHFIFAIIFAIGGPIIVGYITKKSRYIDICFYPLKTIQKIREDIKR